MIISITYFACNASAMIPDAIAVAAELDPKLSLQLSFLSAVI